MSLCRNLKISGSPLLRPGSAPLVRRCADSLLFLAPPNVSPAQIRILSRICNDCLSLDDAERVPCVERKHIQRRISANLAGIPSRNNRNTG